MPSRPAMRRCVPGYGPRSRRITIPRQARSRVPYAPMTSRRTSPPATRSAAAFYLQQLRYTWHKHRIGAIRPRPHRRLGFHAYVLGQRWVEEAGLLELGPSHLLAGVAGELAHNSDSGAAHHVVTAIDRLAGSDAVKQSDVLQVVGVHLRFRTRVCPVSLAGDLELEQIAAAFRAQNQAGILVIAVVDRAAESVDAHTFGKIVDYRMMVEHAAVDLAVKCGSAYHAMAAERRGVTQRPAGTVEVVDQGLWHVVAREPVEVILVARLVFDFLHAGAARIQHIRRPQPGLLNRDDIPDGAVVNPLHGLDVAGMVTALQTGHETQPFLAREIHGLAQPLDADRVDGMRLLEEHVPAGLNRGLGEERMELSSTGDNHHVAGFDDVPIRVKPRETVRIGHFHLVGVFEFQGAALLLDAVEKDVGQRDDVHVVACIHRVHGGRFAATSAADYANADDACTRRMYGGKRETAG